MWTFLKIVFIGLLIMMGLGLIIIFPIAAVGAGIVAFCIWMEWYKAAIIIGIVAFFAQVGRCAVTGVGSGSSGSGSVFSDSDYDGDYGGYSDYEDYESAESDKIGWPEAFVVGNAIEKEREKKE